MEKVIHYLDSSATTEPSEVAKNAAMAALGVYGNPSSTHLMGVEAKHLLDACREKVANALGARKSVGGSVIFTSSGTEANCLALLGYNAAKRRVGEGKRPLILIGEGEHPSVEKPAFRLEELGWRLIRIPTVGGELDIRAIREAMATPHTACIAAFMLVNNETGALYDVKRAAAAVHTADPGAHVHCDAVQAFMKTKLNVGALGVDSLAVSAHKIHAPRGASALWISAAALKRRDIAEVTPGGGQEGGLRSGTENLVCIAAFAAACEDGVANFTERNAKIGALRAYLDASLERLAPLGVSVKTPVKSVPEIVNITLPRIKSETMLNYLSGEGICASAGSACSARSQKLSSALAAFGCDRDEIDSSLRISLSYMNTTEDIDALEAALARGVQTLARF